MSSAEEPSLPESTERVSACAAFLTFPGRNEDMVEGGERQKRDADEIRLAGMMALFKGRLRSRAPRGG